MVTTTCTIRPLHMEYWGRVYVVRELRTFLRLRG
jgi:hypothetical protein